MSRVLMLAGLIGAGAGFVILGPDFADQHSLSEQMALGLLAILMLCTLFGMKVTTVLGFVLRAVLLALIWRCLASVLRVVRLR